MNVDGGGHRDSPTAYSTYGLPADADLSALDGLEPGPPWPQSDHMLFVMHGVPALTLTSSGIFEIVDRVVHTSQDTYEMLDLNTIWEATLYLSEVLSRVR